MIVRINQSFSDTHYFVGIIFKKFLKNKFFKKYARLIEINVYICFFRSVFVSFFFKKKNYSVFMRKHQVLSLWKSIKFVYFVK